MQHIKNILNKHLKQAGLSQNIETALIIKEFEELVGAFWGAKIGKKIKALYIKDRVLTVACLSSVIIQEVSFRKQELLQQINNKFKKEALKDIKFIV